MDSRTRVERALQLDVADRPPAAAWGHTYREEWSPEQLARVTVDRARELGWDFVKFQPRASCFSEAFGAGWDSMWIAKAAIEKAKSLDTDVLVKTLENHFHFVGVWHGGTMTKADHRGSTGGGYLIPSYFTKDGKLLPLG